MKIATFGKNKDIVMKIVDFPGSAKSVINHVGFVHFVRRKKIDPQVFLQPEKKLKDKNLLLFLPLEKKLKLANPLHFLQEETKVKHL